MLLTDGRAMRRHQQTIKLSCLLKLRKHHFHQPDERFVLDYTARRRQRQYQRYRLNIGFRQTDKESANLVSVSSASTLKSSSVVGDELKVLDSC